MSGNRQRNNHARHQVPSSISGLSGWWDYSEASTLTVDGGNLVSEILDKSGHGHTATAAGGAESTLVDFQGRKGGEVPYDNNTIEFDISGSMTVRTLVMVLTHPRGDGDFFNSPFGTDDNDGPRETSSKFPKWDGSGGWQNDDNKAEWVQGIPNGDIPATNTAFISIHERDADSTRSTWKLHNNDSRGSWTGIIGEWIVYDRVLTADERFRLEEYLMQKWDMPRVTPINTALLTRTSNQNYEVADNASFDYSNGFTASCWFYPNSVSVGATRTIIAQWAGAGTRGFSVRLDSSNKLLFLGTFDGSSSSGSNGFDFGTTIITLDQWYHVVATFDGVIARLYLNGKQIATEKESGTIFNTTADFQVGSQGGNRFSGGLAFPRFHTRAIASNEVSKLWNRGRPQYDSELHNDLLSDLVSSWTLVEPFDPSTIPGVEAWYDGSDLSTITDTAGEVDQWDDKSGNGLDLTATGTERPLTSSDTINGLNGIQFDDAPNEMKTATNPFGATVEDAFIIFVMKVNSITSNSILFTLSDADSPSRWQAHVPFSNNEVFFDAGDNAAGGRLQTGTGFFNLSDETIMGFYSSTTEAVQQIWRDGIIVKADDDAFSAIPANDIIVIGSGGSIGTAQLCTIGECLIINGMVTSEDRQKLEGYLAHKWGLETTLANWHPYRYVPPNGALSAIKDQIGTNDFTERNGPIPLTQDKLQMDLRKITKIEPVGVENTDPTINVTLTWTDSDLTKDFLKSRWTNGETKEIHATNYNRLGSAETWEVHASDASEGRIELRKYSFSSQNSASVIVTVGKLETGMDLSILGFANTSGTITGQNTLQSVLVATHNINMIGTDPGDNRLWLDMFGQLTTTGGITISWGKGNRLTLD